MSPALVGSNVLRPRRSRRRARRLRILLELLAVMIIAALTAWIVSWIAISTPTATTLRSGRTGASAGWDERTTARASGRSFSIVP